MSEFTSGSEDRDSMMFDLIKAVPVMDSIVKKRIDSASSDWQAFKPYAQAGEEDMQLIVEGIDRDYWRTYMGEEMTLSGQVYPVEINSNGTSCDIAHDGRFSGYIDDWECLSIGFTALRSQDGDYSLMVLCGVPAQAGSMTVEGQFFATPLDSIIVFKDPDLISEGHLLDLLEDRIPEVMSQVDILLASGSRGDFLKGLGRIDLTDFAVMHRVDENKVPETIVMLNKYIKDKAMLDSGVPFMIDYDGEIFVDKAQEWQKTSKNALLANVGILGILVDSNDQSLKLTIKCLLRGQFEQDDQEILLLLENVSGAFTQRDALG